MEDLLNLNRSSLIDPKLVEEIISYAKRILNRISSVYTYHNLSHTKRVVAISSTIGESMNLCVVDKQLLEIAAWYHDVGFIEGQEGHEERGISILNDFFSRRNLPETFKTIVNDAIRSTKIDEPPINTLGKVLRDADTAHLSFDDYHFYERLIRKELLLTKGKKYEEREWIEINTEFFWNHRYYTVYGNAIFEHGKSKNFEEILNRMETLSN